MKAFREYGRGATSAGHGTDRCLPASRPYGTRTAIRSAIGRAATARKLALVLAGAVALTIAASGSASAAAPVVNEHSNFSDTFPDQQCGIDGTSTVKGVDNFKLYADNTFMETFNIRQVFTAEQSGKSVLISAAQQTSGPFDPIQNPDGTMTFIVTYKGLPEKLSIFHGPTLSRAAGVVTLTQTFSSDGELLSTTASGQHGPHPDLASDFELFCNVLIPALT